VLDDLRHLLLIAEHGTFTEASRRAHLSQPAMTASIQRLEEQLGARLLDRGPGGAQPTEAGLALLPWAEAALAAVSRGRQAVAAVQGLQTGDVRLGAGGTASTYLLPPVLTLFRAQAPGITVRLRESGPEEIVRGVRDGRLDLGIASDVDGEPWRDDVLVVVTAPGIDAASAPWLALNRGTSHRALHARLVPDASIAMELSSLAAVVAHAEAGLGVALVSRMAAAESLAAGRLIEVPHPGTPVARHLRLVHRGHDRLSPAAAALRELLLHSAG
jgi:DNA-binding transcriptional LysR family regulator